MNTSLLRRLISVAAVTLTVLPLCALIAVSTAQAAEPDAADVQEPAAPPHHHSHQHRDHGNDVVNIGSDSHLARGEHADSVISVFGSSTSDGDAGDVVSVLGDTRVSGELSDSAVAVLGSTYIDSKVNGDAIAVLGNVELGPEAEIGGNVVAVGGSVERDPGAIVHGSIQNIFVGHFGGLRTWIHQCLFYGRPLALAHGLGWAWGLAFTFLALYAALALLFREGLTRCVQTFEAQPGQSVLAALIAMLLTPVVVVLLCITVVGIAAVPFVIFGLFCAGLFGKAVMLAWIGGRVTGKQNVGPMSHPAVAVLIGGLLVLVLYLIPVLGFLVYKLLGLLGLGAVVYTLIVALRTRQANRGGERTAAATMNTPGASTDSTASGAATASAAGAAAAPGPEGPAPATEPPANEPPPAYTAALPRAGFWVRMGALLIDAILVGFLLGVLHEHHLELVVLAAYGAVMWKLRGSTVGGIVLDLRVVRLDGREIEWETAIVRALGCFLSLAVAGLGFIWIAFDHNRQAWHDKIAGTVVVRVAKGLPLL